MEAQRWTIKPMAHQNHGKLGVFQCHTKFVGAFTYQAQFHMMLANIANILAVFLLNHSWIALIEYCTVNWSSQNCLIELILWRRTRLRSLRQRVSRTRMEIQAIPKKTERRSFVQFCDIGNAIAICETVSVFPSFISSVSAVTVRRCSSKSRKHHPHHPRYQSQNHRSNRYAKDIKGHISTLGFDSVFDGPSTVKVWRLGCAGPHPISLRCQFDDLKSHSETNIESVWFSCRTRLTSISLDIFRYL